MTNPKGVQPEALSRFAESGDKPGDKPGLTASARTKPVPVDPALEHVAATKVLREGVLHKDEGADAAIDKLPDRILKK